MMVAPNSALGRLVTITVNDVRADNVVILHTEDEEEGFFIEIVDFLNGRVRTDANFNPLKLQSRNPRTYDGVKIRLNGPDYESKTGRSYFMTICKNCTSIDSFCYDGGAEYCKSCGIVTDRRSVDYGEINNAPTIG